MDRARTSTHDVTRLVDDVLARGVAAGATDVHFEPVDEGLLIRARVDGHLVDLDMLPSGLAENVLSRLKVLGSLLTYRIDIPQEGGLVWREPGSDGGTGSRDLRIAVFPTIRGERAAVRIFSRSCELRTLDSLGFAADQLLLIRTTLAQPAGFVVVSGPAGSGKTTTLYAMIRELRDRHPGRSVITLEDPVEQRINRVTQIQINPHGELGYERCMRSLLRQDPQVILLGEVRDERTATAAVEAALTGHLILTTVHSGDPAETVVRFQEMGIPSYQLTSALTLICAQRLLRRRCRSCADQATRGCDACFHTGYVGRTAVAQVARIEESMRALILQHAPAAELRRAFRRQDLDMDERAAALVAGGTTDAAEIARVLGRPPID